MDCLVPVIRCKTGLAGLGTVYLHPRESELVHIIRLLDNKRFLSSTMRRTAYTDPLSGAVFHGNPSRLRKLGMVQRLKKPHSFHLFILNS